MLLPTGGAFCVVGLCIVGAVGLLAAVATMRAASQVTAGLLLRSVLSLIGAAFALLVAGCILFALVESD